MYSEHIFLSFRFFSFYSTPGGGPPHMKGGGDARRKFWIKPLKETDLGVAQAFFDPKK